MSKHSSDPSINPVPIGLFGGDAIHFPAFFKDIDCAYDLLLEELKQREEVDGLHGTYWRTVSAGNRRSEPSVTRVRRLPDAGRYPTHASVIQRMARLLGIRVEGWWVNHYNDGSAIKNMHRDGWGRDRGINITLGASFGSDRTLRFEAAHGEVHPREQNVLQRNGDVIAFGDKVNHAYRHGVPAEPAQGPRISIIIMGKAPADWAKIANMARIPEFEILESHVQVPAVRSRRWGQKGESGMQASGAAQVSSQWRGKRQNLSSADLTQSSGEMNACIVWLRDDLRLTDNPALHAAVHSGCDAVVPVFIHDTADPSPWPVRGAALWWKGESIKAFESSLHDSCASRLTIRIGDVVKELFDIAQVTNSKHVYFNRQVEPWYHERDMRVQMHLEKKGLTVKSFKSVVLQEPWEGSPPRMFMRPPDGKTSMYDEVSPGKIVRIHEPWNGSSPATHMTQLTLPDVASIINADRLLSNPNPCAQLLTAIGEDDQDGSDARRRDPDHFLVYKDLESGAAECEAQPLPSVSGHEFPPPREWPASLTVDDLGYLETAGNGFPATGQPQCSKLSQDSESGAVEGDWAAEMRKFWTPGEAAAISRLQAFVATIETHKRPDRHRADLPNTSLLSPYLRFGEISPRQCYFEAMRAPAHLRHGFIRRVLWRDLSYAELYRWPDMPKTSQRMQYEDQWWSGTSSQLRKWQRGETGFPLIDAGMRQLWRQGYINNYMRHITAGFLIDYLDISWKSGFEWYDYTLVDSDAAINARLWQQGGHSGVSQWNFVMHPVFAAKNADPTGDYVRRWVPELAGMPTNFIHRPWEAPLDLMAISVRLGSTYPRRMLLDLTAARKKHLRNVLAVRAQYPECQSSDGTEYLLLRDGSRVLLRTRDDIRQDTDELIVAQTADDSLHGKNQAKTGRSALNAFQQCMMDQQSTIKSGGHRPNDLHIL
jgi:deoxyribodipyrimidine photolyase